MESLRQLTRYDVLLPLGVSLCFAGIILRSFARSSRRALDLRKQHRLHDQKLAAANQLDESTSWFERHLSVIANTTAIGGLVIAVIALIRK